MIERWVAETKTALPILYSFPGYSCVGYVQIATVKWYAVYTLLAGQLGFRRTVMGPHRVSR